MLCYVPKCNNFGRHKFPSEATAKNAWIKWLNEPEKRKLGCRWQFHAVGPRSSLPHPPPKSNFGDCSQWAQPSGPYVGSICLDLCEWVPYLSEYVCNIWLRSNGRVERKGGYRHTDSWHEWVQDNFYGRSATKRIVIKEPSLFTVQKLNMIMINYLINQTYLHKLLALMWNPDPPNLTIFVIIFIYIIT